MSDRYEQIREDIPILELLVDLGAETRGWGGSGWNDWRPITCPFCSDTNNSASYHPVAGMFICHQCGAPERPEGKPGGVVDVAKFYLGYDMNSTRDDKEAIDWLNRRFRR